MRTMRSSAASGGSQAVGAFRGASRASEITAAWTGDLAEPGFRAACADALRAHASTRERQPHVEAFYAGIWEHTGAPSRVLDLGCGLGPLALPWMGLADDTFYFASDVDRRPLSAVAELLELRSEEHTSEL